MPKKWKKKARQKVWKNAGWSGKTITITDPHTINAVRSEMDRRGDGTAAKTARELILERLAKIKKQETANVIQP